MSYAYFTVVGLVAALALTAWFVVEAEFDGTRFALIVLVLLQARANLKQHKDAKLLRKLRERVQLRADPAGRKPAQIKAENLAPTEAV